MPNATLKYFLLALVLLSILGAIGAYYSTRPGEPATATS